MHEIGASIASTAALVGGPLLTVMGARAMRIKQMLDATPTSRIRSMAMGMVEVQGTVVPRSQVNAPFSSRPCAYWEVELATRVTRGSGSSAVHTWETVHTERSGNPFFVRDETGVALVYPQGAECHLPFGVEEETNGLGVPDLYMDYMKSRHLALAGVWALGPMRFRERTLEEDYAVFVLGRAQPKAMALTVSQEEEQATGTDGGLGVKRLRSLDQESRGVIRRGANDPVFLISNQSEKTTAFEFGLRAIGGLSAGPAVGLFGVWCVLQLIQAGHYFQ